MRSTNQYSFCFQAVKLRKVVLHSHLDLLQTGGDGDDGDGVEDDDGGGAADVALK